MKKEATRDRLLTAALALFAEHGYDNTSVSQIAAHAGVTEMTFFRHFPAKQNLLIEDPYDPLIGRAIAEQPVGLDPISRAARGIRQAWRALPERSTEEVRMRLRIVAHTPALRAGLVRGTEATEAVIVEALTAGSASRKDAIVAAGAVMGALNAALLEWSVTDGDELGSAIESAVSVLEAGRG